MSALRHQFHVNADGTRGLTFSFAPCTREPGSWREEVYATARDIARKAQKPIWVCASGGIDSEIVCRAFFDQGINFSVLTLAFEGGKNEHDMRYATKWCAEHGVKQLVVPFNAEKFLIEEVEVYAESYVALHPFRYFQIRLMELVESMGGYAVLAGGEQLYYVQVPLVQMRPEDVHLIFAIGNTVPFDWCNNTQTQHEPYFYFRTPEVCASFLRHPLVSFALQNPSHIFGHTSNTYLLKRMAYQAVWTDLELRFKATGFERVQKLVDDAQRRMREKFKDSLLVYRLPVVEFQKQLAGTGVLGKEKH